MIGIYMLPTCITRKIIINFFLHHIKGNIMQRKDHIIPDLFRNTKVLIIDFFTYFIVTIKIQSMFRYSKVRIFYK